MDITQTTPSTSVTSKRLDGDTFSFEQIRTWLEQSGFGDVRLLDVPAVSPLILATKLTQ